MKRPGYREAVEWIVFRDDISGVLDRDDDRIPSVTMCIVAGLFDVKTERVMDDIQRYIEKCRGM